MIILIIGIILIFQSKTIFQLPAFVFMQLESAIVQVSCNENFLLVSTENWCYVCDTNREQYKQIGSKPREGPFGACFFKTPDNLNIYSARPGSRLWEVTTNGMVESTHQFKKALASPPVEVVLLEENRVEVPKQSNWPEQAFNFCYLTPIMDRYLFTYKEDGIYLFDPVNVRVVLWSNHIRNISSAKCVNYTIYIWTSRGELHSLVINSLDKCLLSLYFQEEYKLCCDLCDIFLDTVSNPNDYSLLSPLTGLLYYMENCDLRNERVLKFVENISKHVSCKLSILASKLDSGIFLVENRHWKKWKIVSSSDSDGSEGRPRFRSNSVPPIPVCRRLSSNSHESYSSLPNMKMTLESQNIYVNESCTSDDEISGMVEDSSQSEHSVPESPFLLSASSDIFQNSLFELGQNLLGKSINGTVPLKNKWPMLEGKFKRTTKDDFDYNEQKPIVLNGFREPNPTISIDIDDLVIRNQVNSDQNRKKTIILDCSDVVKFCGELENSDYADTLVSFQMFDCILQKYSQLNQSVDADLQSNFTKKGFPFSKYVPSICFNVIKTAFHGAIKSGQMRNYLEKMRDSCFSSLDSAAHPQLLMKVFAPQILKLDVRLRNLLVVFSEIIDPFSILQCIESSELPCFYLSWCLILDIFQDSAFNYITKKDESSTIVYTDWPLPLLLNTIFLMFRLNQVDSSCNISDDGNLALHHISYLVLKLSTHLLSSGTLPSECDKQCNELILKYFSKVMDKDGVNYSEVSASPVRQHVENAFLALNCPKRKVCVCGYNILVENSEPPKYPMIGRLLMQMYLRDYKTRNHTFCGKFELKPLKFPDTYTDVEENVSPQYSLDIIRLKPVLDPESNMFSFCKDYLPIVNLIRAMPSLINCVILQTDCDLMESSYFVVQFGLFKSLNEYIAKAPEEFLRNLCDLNREYARGVCCFCTAKSEDPIDVNWNELMKLVLKSLGGPKTIKLLEDYTSDIPSTKLDVR